MSDAESLVQNPTEAFIEAQRTVTEASRLSQSFARADFPQEDGSCVVVSSFQGSDVGIAIFGPDQNVIVNPPAPSDAIPEGIQDDGRNTYDETGPPEGLVDVDS